MQQNSQKRRYYLAWWKDRLKLKTLADLYDRLADAEKAIRSLTAGKAKKSGKTLGAERCGLYLHADDDKGRKERFQPLSRELVEKLIEYGSRSDTKKHYAKMRAKAGAKPDENVPANPLLYVPQNSATMLKKDLEAAGIPVMTVKGKLDFHALRTAYINFVLDSGENVKTAQELARHSTPHLTMNIYGRAADFRLARVAEAVGQMIAQPTAENADASDAPAENGEKLHIPGISTLNGDLTEKETPCMARGYGNNTWYRRVELKETRCRIKACMIQDSLRHIPDIIPRIPVTTKRLHLPQIPFPCQTLMLVRQMKTNPRTQKMPKRCPKLAQVFLLQ